MRRFFVAVALLTGLSTSVVLAAPTIEVSVSPTEISVGDRVEMIVTVHSESGGVASVRFQEWDATLGPAEILEVGPVEQLRRDGDRTSFRQRLTLTIFQLGEVTLPPVEAVVMDAAGETPLTSLSSHIVVRSVLPEDAEAVEAKPPAPPERVGLGGTFWWSASALLATCLIAIVALWMQSNDPDTDQEGRPRLAPMEELRRSLAALRDESAAEPIHAEISLAVRRFLGRVVGFPAPESTTTEVRQELRVRDLSTDLVRDTNALLSDCDLVMFARQEVPLETARSRISDAQAIADRVFTATQAATSADEPEGDAA